MQEFEHDFLPRSPWRREGVQPEGAHAGVVCLRVFCDPLRRLPPHDFLRDNAAAVRAGPCDRAGYLVDFFPADPLVGVLEVDPVEYDLAVLAALRALVTPALLRAFLEAVRDIGRAFNGRRRYFDGLCIVEGGLSGLSQRPWIALGSGAYGPAVALVAYDIAGRSGGKGRGAVGSGDCQHTAREGLLEDCVPGVPCLYVRNLGFQHLAVPDHWSDTQPGELAGVVERGLHIKDRARILVYDIADYVQLKLGLSHLRGRHHDNFFHFRIGERFHRLPEVGRACCAPRACLCGGFRR